MMYDSKNVHIYPPAQSSSHPLGLEGSQFSSTFSDDELKKAYRQAVRRSHPDAPGGSAKTV